MSNAISRNIEWWVCNRHVEHMVTGHYAGMVAFCLASMTTTLCHTVCCQQHSRYNPMHGSPLCAMGLPPRKMCTGLQPTSLIVGGMSILATLLGRHHRVPYPPVGRPYHWRQASLAPHHPEQPHKPMSTKCHQHCGLSQQGRGCSWVAK